jgi:hypothetical protein
MALVLEPERKKGNGAKRRKPDFATDPALHLQQRPVKIRQASQSGLKIAASPVN